MAESPDDLAVLRPASAQQRIIGVLMVLISLTYLLLFVPRGWVPHDEGMLGQSAERVLHGGVPHVDYEETYTGGLTWLYAAVFRFAGIDLLMLRWVLYAGASLAQLVVYAILRRYLAPITAALISWMALAWSFPNFFAGLPSWWILICALCCLWAFIRYVETGTIRYAALAGLATGIAIVIKQTGVYLLVALIMSLLYDGSGRDERARPGSGNARAVLSGAALCAFLFALAILRSKLVLSEILSLLLPVAACSWFLASSGDKNPLSRSSTSLATIIAALTCAILPSAIFAAPYVVHRQLPQLINGLLVLPQKRLTFASMDMPPASFLLYGIPLIALLTLFRNSIHSTRLRGHLLVLGTFTVGVTLCLASIYNVWAYQLIWRSSRAFAALLPLAVCWLLASARIHDSRRQRMLFAFAAMLAWASLVQFPFSAPIYFCYVAPLAIVAGAAAADVCSPERRRALFAWGVQALIFAVVIMNRGYIHNLGQSHEPQAFTAELGLERAHLRVSANDARVYRRVATLVARHAGTGSFIAGPDSPEVYFLTGHVNPSGALFDFLSDDGGTNLNTGWAGTNVIVLNRQPAFSPAVSEDLLEVIRKVFPAGRSVGKFEVRWR